MAHRVGTLIAFHVKPHRAWRWTPQIPVVSAQEDDERSPGPALKTERMLRRITRPHAAVTRNRHGSWSRIIHAGKGTLRAVAAGFLCLKGEGLGRLSSDALLKRTTLTDDGGRGGEERRQTVAKEL